MMIKKTTPVFLVFVILGFFLASSCGEKEEKGQKSRVVSKKIKAPEKKGAVKPDDKVKTEKERLKKGRLADRDKIVIKTPKMTLQKEYRYNPAGKVDPFLPLFEKEKIVVAEKAKKKVKIRKPQTPLEKIDLSQLKLTAILMAESGARALVEQASGRGYIIKVGTYVGINAGRVSKIEKNLVVIDEQVVDMFGTLTDRRNELKLRKTSGDF